MKILSRGQQVKDVFSIALVVFFSIVTFVGLELLGHGSTSVFAIAAATFGLIGTFVSLGVAIVLVLGSNEGHSELSAKT